ELAVHSLHDLPRLPGEREANIVGIQFGSLYVGGLYAKLAIKVGDLQIGQEVAEQRIFDRESRVWLEGKLLAQVDPLIGIGDHFSDSCPNCLEPRLSALGNDGENLVKGDIRVGNLC